MNVYLYTMPKGWYSEVGFTCFEFAPVILVNRVYLVNGDILQYMFDV